MDANNTLHVRVERRKDRAGDVCNVTVRFQYIGTGGGQLHAERWHPSLDLAQVSAPLRGGAGS
jgi:hypothetical protein